MTTRAGWKKERKGQYYNVEEMGNGAYAIAVVRSIGNPYSSETQWQAAATVKENLTETVKWIDACFRWFNDDPWNVDIVEFFDTLGEAQDVYDMTLLELKDGNLLPNGDLVETA